MAARRGAVVAVRAVQQQQTAVHQRRMASFDSLLRNSALFKLDKAIYGRHVLGTIQENLHDKVVVDVGLKFPVTLLRKEIGSAASYHRTQPGRRVVVQLDDPELTAHFLGDDRHTSTMQAKGSFVRLPLDIESSLQA